MDSSPVAYASCVQKTAAITVMTARPAMCHRQAGNRGGTGNVPSIVERGGTPPILVSIDRLLVVRYRFNWFRRNHGFRAV